MPGGPVPDGAGVLRGLEPHLRGWLPEQRWFAGKGREISGFRLLSAVELLPCDGPAPGLLHLLLDVEQPEAAADCYQLLLGVREAVPARLAAAVVGRVREGPLAGRTVYEALHDPLLAGTLLERLRAGGRTGPLRFTAEPGTAITANLPPRLSGAEQSNSSVIYGDAFILKVFRRVPAGTNPDLEVSLALARSGCPRVPAPAAWFEALGLHGEPATLGLLQRFLGGSREGWELALESADGGPDFAGEARALGVATAQVHAALAAALPTEVLDPAQVGLLATAMSDRLDVAARAVPSLAGYAKRLRGAYADLAELGVREGGMTAQRVHGDLHLGQVLRTGRGWVLIDFEGEPARPLSERRRPQPPVQDVAGMLRSFDYAARHRDPGSPVAAAWARRQRAAFCAGYAEAGGEDPAASPVALRAYETDKAVYEVLYEARHRPRWLPIPMAAVERLAA